MPELALKQTIKCLKIAEEIPFNGGQMVKVFFLSIEVGSWLFYDQHVATKLLGTVNNMENA